MVRHHFESRKAILGLLLLVGCVLPTPAQEVRWQHDYRTAYEESRATSRPLLIDFGTDNCFYCKKLDETTFRDPGVVEMIGSEFVALKVNATHHPALARALRVQSYPTLVFAAPDGTVLNRLVGYRDSPTFRQHMEQTLASVPASGQMLRDYQEASVAISAPDYPRAIALLRKVAGDGGRHPAQLKARQLLQEFERLATERLQWVRAMQQKGQQAEASAALFELVRLFEGTTAAREANVLLSARAP